jgi:hypothetical protein
MTANLEMIKRNVAVKAKDVENSTTRLEANKLTEGENENAREKVVNALVSDSGLQDLAGVR